MYNTPDGLATVDIISAEALCTTSWSQNTWTVFAWLVVVLIVAVVFGGVTLGFYRQVRDPSLVRRNFGRNAPQNIPLEQPQGQQGWMVPPYPGPPQGARPQFEKNEYQPEAEWANESLGPAAQGENPFETGGSTSVHRAEDEAWERARTGGVTAHLTGHAAPPKGYAVA